jgi:hypothetical protein
VFIIESSLGKAFLPAIYKLAKVRDKFTKSEGGVAKKSAHNTLHLEKTLHLKCRLKVKSIEASWDYITSSFIFAFEKKCFTYSEERRV